MAQPYRIRTDKSWLETLDDLETEFGRWGVTRKNWTARKDGKKAILRWIPKGSSRDVELESSDQFTVEDNLRKLFKLVQDLRGLEMRGYSQEVASYYAQTTAIVEHASSIADRYAPYHVLGITTNADKVTVDAVVRGKRIELHPDKPENGPNEAADLARINGARDAIYAERGWQ